MPGWHKSSYSDREYNCVEVRETAHVADVRDSQNREHGHIRFPASEWSAFLADVRTGEL
ncbi:hypothetical protein F4561_005704 [Lipingzhangella halophila]|uniref:DUF397 domain-containing protein n=1 Tax=Lipingzhangella halophila TaxID=1783352 RepID=A0A7W7RMP1_9ACTN|nr:DUF397 domain-containing protein [Lipingzhangella halophila]MBB4934810.1 hypothetical protein [Lipingzhangella halophila]